MTFINRWSPAFEVDSDTVGTQTAYIGEAEASATEITLTCLDPCPFLVGWEVTVRGVGELFDGSYHITAVSGYTFSYSYTGTVVAHFFVVPAGVASSPSPSFVRWGGGAATLDNITSLTTLFVEPWDYNTLRIVWGVDTSLAVRASRDIGNGLVPRVVIVRSTFGYPMTPWDGVQVLNRPYADITTYPYFETQPGNVDNDWNRPPLPVQSLFDRNLEPGKWCYYTVFLWIGQYDILGALVTQPNGDQQVWAVGKSQDALTPVNHEHGDKLYNLVPQYYLTKDQEFIAATGRKGVIARLLQIIGFELDYTRTLADGTEHVYDIDSMHDDLMRSQGALNFGVPVEDGLGDIRYRSLLATISRLYEERGSTSGLKRMTDAATKYRSKLVEGINMMCLTDDAEFATATGSWGNPFPVYEAWMDNTDWLGGDIVTFRQANFASVSLPTTPEGSDIDIESLVPRRNAMLISPSTLTGFDSDLDFDDDLTDFDYGGVDAGILITCGLGDGVTFGRRHEEITSHFFPRLHGIRCLPGDMYRFSIYSALAEEPSGRTGFDSTHFDFDEGIEFDGGGPIPGKLAIGIMWFNDPQNDGVFNIDNDYLDRTETDAETEVYGAGIPMRRYIVASRAPESLRAQPHVWAVPYLVFEDSAHSRYVSAGMFHAALNIAEDFMVEALP